jgi:hypothetical protein
MLKLSKITLDPGEVVLCDHCKQPLTDEVAEIGTPGYYHQSCAFDLTDINLDYMAFMDDAQEYAKSKGE